MLQTKDPMDNLHLELESRLGSFRWSPESSPRVRFLVAVPPSTRERGENVRGRRREMGEDGKRFGGCLLGGRGRKKMEGAALGFWLKR